MDLSGRFDFWRMLIHTRAITPPRVAAELWPRIARLSRETWWLVLVALVVGFAAILHLALGDLPSPAVASRPPAVSAPAPAPVAPAPPAKPAVPW